MQQTTLAPQYVIYASLLVSLLARFNWIITPSDGLSIVLGIVTLAGVIWSHFATKTANTAGIKAGYIVTNK